jgi:hypothetical protein
MSPILRTALNNGMVIPAMPLALDANRKFDERRERGLFRYYIAAGSGGVAIGVHTTQFAIRDPKINLFKPLLEIGREEIDRADASRSTPLVRIAGICGDTAQACRESELVRGLGYQGGLLSLAALKSSSEDELIQHCRTVSEIVPIIGFYLQPAVGGRTLPFSFWRRFAEIENVVAIKMAPFNRYQTIDVVRAVTEAGREDIALYTGNDDNIVLDLLTPYRFLCDGKMRERRIVGGLLGHWSVWTQKAVALLNKCHAAVEKPIPPELLRRNIEVTDCNAAFFDAAHCFHGCIAGLHEVLRRQGLLEGTWCLDPNEALSAGQAEDIDRVYRSYPHLNDDTFVAEHRDEWLR